MAPPYATVDDYTLLTGIAVPPEDEPRIEAGLDQASSLIASYLGDNEAQVFATAPESLRNMTVARVRYEQLVPLGIRSESIGPPPSPTRRPSTRSCCLVKRGTVSAG